MKTQRGGYHGNAIAGRARAKRAPGAIKLSQCMIVKNEEKNIERALAWARDIAYEQIVVDTGSEDRTVELAEKMGAKVFHFEWIDDFAAAKNFAIEKARGDWIAFLDADEYMEADDRAKLLRHIAEVTSNPRKRDYAFLQCNWLQLDDSGAVFVVMEQCRVFRNRPDIRYIGRIHEGLDPRGGLLYHMADVNIMHTGYTRQSYKETNKARRNIKLLREEMRERPDDLELKVYLADALSVGAESDAERAEMDELYGEAIESDEALPELLWRNAYDDRIIRALQAGNTKEVERLSRRAAERMPHVPDYAYYLGLALQSRGDMDGAWEEYRRCETTIETTPRLQNRMTDAGLYNMFENMAKVAINRGDWRSAIDYISLVLITDKYKEEMLTLLIGIMGAVQSVGLSSERDRIEYLRRFYDLDAPEDKLFLAKCAKTAKDDVLMIYFYRTLTDADKASLEAEARLTAVV
jgi:glycosyltransferase involved in cell wall biosynthesis